MPSAEIDVREYCYFAVNQRRKLPIPIWGTGYVDSVTTP
jgi:hypothetical protein